MVSSLTNDNLYRETQNKLTTQEVSYYAKNGHLSFVFLN